MPDLLLTGYTTPAPTAFPQQGGGDLSPRSGLQPPGGYSSLGAVGADPGSTDKKKASQQAYQEELKRQVHAVNLQIEMIKIVECNNTIFILELNDYDPYGCNSPLKIVIKGV